MKQAIKVMLLIMVMLLAVSACTSVQTTAFEEDAERYAVIPKQAISSKFYYIDTNEPYDPGKERTGFLPDSVKDIDFYVEMGSKDRAFKIVMDKWTCVIPAMDAQFLKYYIEGQLKEEDHETIRDTSGALLKDKQMHLGDSIWAEDLVVKATSDSSKSDKAIVVINRVRMDGDFYVVIGFIIRHYYGIIFPYHELGWLCLTPKKAKQLIKVLTAVDEHYKKGE
ncbi:MAG: hypothetical protein BWY74_00299 [Firmicutes bacterium ADurb.Bin419]|nr:MAG: hypothetical protein BWY74_00299 [Firmicutes bacterium ADurb.Bin419]